MKALLGSFYAGESRSQLSVAILFRLDSVQIRLCEVKVFAAAGNEMHLCNFLRCTEGKETFSLQ